MDRESKYEKPPNIKNENKKSSAIFHDEWIK